MLLWRSLFFIALIFIGQFFARTYDQISIDTDLKDLSPSLAQQQDLQFAINQLSSDIERRFILLLTGTDSTQVQQASELVLKQLAHIKNLRIADLNDQQFSKLLAKLKRHRFQLLTTGQQNNIQELDDNELAEQAQRRLFQLQGSINLLPFADDPMGWLNDYVLQFISATNPQGKHSRKDGTQTTGYDKNEPYYQAIAVTIDHGALEMSTQKTLLTQLQTLERNVLEQYPVVIRHSGVFFFAADAAAKAQKDISLISTFSLIGVLVLLLTAFRTLSALWLPFLSILLGVGGALAVTHTWFGSVHILTILSGASLIGIVIDYSLHYFYHQNYNYNNPEKNKHLYSALLLSLLTSIIGFGALGLSELDSLKKLAVFTCFGLIMAWLSVLSLGPWLLRKPVVLDQRYIPKLLNILIRPLRSVRQRTIIILGLAMLFCFSALMYIGISSNDDPRLFFKPSATLLEQENYTNKLINNYEPGRYLIIHGKNAEQIYSRFDELKSTKNAKEINSLNSVMNWLPSPQQQDRNYQIQQRLHQHNGIIEKLFSLLGMPDDTAMQLHTEYQQANQRLLKPGDILTLLPGSANSLWFEHNNKVYSFALIPKGMDTTAIEIASKNIDGIEFINAVALAENALQQQRISASQLLVYAYILIAMLMILRFRSFAALWMLAVPISATMGTVIVLALFGQAMNLFHTMALFLILGLGMDYVIFAREMPKTHITLQAILLSALTTLLSFGLLSISSIPVVQAFGITVLIGNTINLFCALAYAQLHHANKETKVYAR